jgi:hypothetical protein
MEQSVPKRRHIKFRRRGITSKKHTTFRTQRKCEIKVVQQLAGAHPAGKNGVTWGWNWSGDGNVCFWCKTSKITPWSRIIRIKTAIRHPLQKILACYWTRIFSTLFTKVCHLSSCSVRLIQSTPSQGVDVQRARCTSTPAPAVTVSSLWRDGQIPTAHRTSP